MIPASMPPYCSGKGTPSSPSSPALASTSKGTRSSSSIALAIGATSFSANSRTACRSSLMSSENSYSIVGFLSICVWRGSDEALAL